VKDILSPEEYEREWWDILECTNRGYESFYDVNPETRATLMAHDAALRAENERLRALALFGKAMLAEWWDDGNPGDIDGADAQEAAEASGLWHQVERHADGVECEWCGGEGPCGELTEAGLAALASRGGRS